MLARLTIVRGEGSPAVLEFGPGQPVTLGRSRDNNLILRDEHASREHARVYFENGHWYLEEIKARNGTHVNGTKLEGEMRLVDGHQIGIAETRLRFDILRGEPTPPHLPVLADEPLIHDEQTTLQMDELTALYDFMSATVAESNHTALVERALKSVQRHTGAALCGYLSLDPEQPLSRIVEPEQAQVDGTLSKQLTQRVKKEGRRVWLYELRGEIDHTESLMPFDDAVCLPLRAEGAPLGALHLYKKSRNFTAREVRFCELVAGFLANQLARLQLCRALQAENSRLRTQTVASDDLIGGGGLMQHLKQLIHRAAQCPSTVLIHGETGAGKELVAHALHHQSPRRRGPFVVVNCGAIVPTLLESELFGHCEGAFTDAKKAHPGFFQQADDGTLFLDEIGDMPLDFQVKLLRVIEGKGFRPVKSTSEIRPDVRIIAATHKDLQKEVKAGRFRQDLYYRLKVITLTVPPLRERLDDVAVLADHFVKKFAAQINRKKKLSPEALRRLLEYPWPGNVRELRTTLESAVMLSEDEVIKPSDLVLQDAMSSEMPPGIHIHELEKWAIQQALKKTKGNVSAAAKLVGFARDTLTKKIGEYGIDRDDCSE